MQPKITILLVTYNRRDLLERCLSCVYETSTDDERNIIIWDNASEDDTSDFLGTMIGFKGIRILRSKNNIGTAARQRMLKLVETPYVLSLDDDAWLTIPGWAKATTYIMDNAKNIGVMAMGGSSPDPTFNFGVVHDKLEKPFFRFNTVVITKTFDPYVEVPHPGTEILDVGNYQVQLHLDENNPPYAVSGLCTAYRTEIVRQAIWGSGSGIMTDMAEHWGRHMVKCGMRTGVLLGYGFAHPCPGPLYYLGRYENYWKKRCEQAPVIYNRSSEEQWLWYKQAIEWSGWGQPLQDADRIC